ncbi:hypothetical protein DXT99_16165 [Pontibacter diazotrophicus]|uniref:Uncharacterized protein n=1 Tax=Pontibacter diazotrophicus TaxID=1400979 RepID=A0A3D8L9K6_9BACT|nr:hypothetical protein [Pontibacter diazotrophicus]RDV14101.1 hypothetical protein DXT99_16165 [Pontibacter diazotrophicus]
MRKVLYLLMAGGFLTFGSCNSPAEEREDVIEESEDLTEAREEGDREDIVEERRELKEEMEEYNEAVAEEADTTIIIQ